MSDEGSKLGVILDGANLSELETRALWLEFSEHMDANRGDMVGYAKKKGWFSVAPEYRGGKAVLIVRTTATAKGPPPVGVPPRPQQKAKPKPSQGARPQAPQKARPKPAQGARPRPKPPQKAPAKPAQPRNPAAKGGQAPPKKRPA